MSLQPQIDLTVPEQTARVARAAFPKGTAYLTARDGLGTLFHDGDFADLYPAVGQHAAAPWRLALVTVLQFAENLTDRQAADAVRGRLDWKYALSLELEDPGFDFRVLSEFRGRLLAGAAEERLLGRMLELFKERGLIKARGRQRTDSTHVLGAVRELNRLELAGEAMLAALNALAEAAPEWLRVVAPPEWAEPSAGLASPASVCPVPRPSVRRSRSLSAPTATTCSVSSMHRPRRSTSAGLSRSRSCGGSGSSSTSTTRRPATRQAGSGGGAAVTSRPRGR